MDFIKLLSLLDELLYEFMVMLVFYPRTLSLTVRHPQRMMDYADTELGDVQSVQYDDTLSPPLFLMISMGIAHLTGQAANSEADGKLPGLLANVENLLALRLVLFSLFPLLMGAQDRIPGLAALALILVWYVWLEATWFRDKLAVSMIRGWSIALSTTAIGILAAVLSSVLVLVTVLDGKL